MGLLRLLPSKKKVVFVVFVFLLGFLSGSTIVFKLAANYPEKIRYEIYRYKFTYLRLTRKLITTKDIEGDRVSVYSEHLDGKTIKVINFDKLETIIKKVYSDFPIFITSKYGILMPPKKYNRYSSLSITFVGRETFSLYDNLDPKKGPFAAFAQGNEIYLKSWNLKFNISIRENTIRHELFHYLASKYRLTYFLPHADAKEFGELKLISFPKKK